MGAAFLPSTAISLVSKSGVVGSVAGRLRPPSQAVTAAIMSAPSWSKVIGDAASSSSATTSSALHAAAPALKDCTSTAIGFFSGVRIPSSLIAGAALGAIFSLVQKSKQEDKLNRAETITLKLYHILTLVAFCLSISSIVITTAASTQLLLGIHNPMASDVYHFLKREFNFEFVVTRWSFLVSLLCFVTGVCGRALLEFDLLQQGKTNQGLMVIFTMGGLILNLLSFVNGSLHCWPSLFGMTAEVVVLLLRRSRTRPLAAAAMISLFGAFVCGVQIMIAPNKKKEDEPLLSSSPKDEPKVASIEEAAP